MSKGGNMKTEYDYQKDELHITLSDSDLQNAFKTEHNYLSLLHSIAEKAGGKDFANRFFSIGGGRR